VAFYSLFDTLKDLLTLTQGHKGLQGSFLWYNCLFYVCSSMVLLLRFVIKY